MRKYEALILVKPELSQDQINSLLEEFKAIIEEKDGKVEEAKMWKKTGLAYEIDNYNRGIYLLTIFEIFPKNLDGLERLCKLNDNIIRYLFTKK